MNFAYEFLSELLQLNDLLMPVIKDEGFIRRNTLSESGFLIKNYSLKIMKFNSLKYLEKLRSEIDRIILLENEMNYEYDSMKAEIRKFELEYNSVMEKNVRLGKIIKQCLGDLPYLCGLIKQNLVEIEIYLSSNKIHIKSIPYKISNSFKSLEKRLNQVLRIIQFFVQLDKSIISFQKDEYYPDYFTYGRAMSAYEFKRTLKKNQLIGSRFKKHGLISVFSADSKIVSGLESLSLDERKSFFAEIGSINAIHVIYFITKLKPRVGPIVQKNGLREYKFPAQIPIKIVA